MKKRMQTRIHSIQHKKHNALFLVQRQCKCLTIAQSCSVFSRKQQFQTLPHWYDFSSLLLKNANLPANNLKLIPILVDLVLLLIVKQEISQNIVMLNFYHFLTMNVLCFCLFLFP